MSEFDPKIVKRIEASKNAKSSVSLNSAKITALPPSIGELTQVKKLSLQFNKLTTLPDEIAKLTHLNELDAGRNQLRRGAQRQHAESPAGVTLQHPIFGDHS